MFPHTRKSNVHTKIGLILFLILFLSYAYFPQNIRNDNVISRMALTLAILDEGTFKINAYQEATDDIAFYNGNYYTDKAPGMSFMAIPSAAAARQALLASRGLASGLRAGRVTREFGVIVYTSTLFTSGLLTAASALALYFLALKISGHTSGALFATMAFGLATPAWGWATAFFGHASTGACLFLGLAAIYSLDQSPAQLRRDALLGSLAGGLLAWAVVIEYTSLPAVAILVLYGLFSARRWEKGKKMWSLGGALAGGMLLALPLAFYNASAFGSLFRVGYGNVPGFSGLEQGLFGLTYPRPQVVAQLLFFPYRGLLWFAPILIMTPFGLYLIWQRAEERMLAAAIIAIMAAAILINASYFYWDGGWSTGPRHLTPMLSFACLPLAVLWARGSSKLRVGIGILLLLSVLIALVSVSVDMMSPDDYPNPLGGYLIPRFLAGEIQRPFFVTGIKGHFYLIPLVGLWVLGLAVIARQIDREN